MHRKLTLDAIQHALSLSDFDVAAAHRLMAPVTRGIQRPAEKEGHPRTASVLLLLYCRQNTYHLVLTRRRADLSSHAGQISFPGGKHEPGETLVQAALREAYEEVGVRPADVHVLGELATIYIPPSDFEVHPFVGWVADGSPPRFIPQESEVAAVLEVPLTHLLNPATRKVDQWQFRDEPIDVPYFDIDGNIVWGATAIMLSEFVGRLRVVMEE